VDIDYIVDIVSGVSIPLPDYWELINPSASSEPLSDIKVTKQGSSPHKSAVLLSSDPVNKLNDVGVIMVTR